MTTSSTEIPIPVADAQLLESRLRHRVLELEECNARLERELYSLHAIAPYTSSRLDAQALRGLRDELQGHEPVPELLRDGRMVPVAEAPPAIVLDLSDLMTWRLALLDVCGLRTSLFLREGRGRVPAGCERSEAGNRLQDPDCRDAAWRGLNGLSPDDRTCRALCCDACGGPLWAVPIPLVHRGEAAVLGHLVLHDAHAELEPRRRMAELVANLAGRRASEEYARQANAVLRMQILQVVAAYTEERDSAVLESRRAMQQQAATAAELARAKVELELALESAGRARQDAERANETKSLYLAAMSHEIRTPLTCVIGFADLLTLPTLGERDVRKFAASIKESSEVLLSLINNVLDLSRIEAGQLELEVIDYSLRALTDEVAGIFAPSCLGKGIDLTVEVDEAVAEDQQGDPTRVRQVLMNLVGNAVKFTHHGRVAVTCRAHAEREGWLDVCVADTGIGIPPARLDRIFEAFQQGERSMVRRHGGSGLGLAITRRIVLSMGGDLTVESRENEGSRFSFRIPGRLSPR
jgi:signal transduction histidine kinase